MKKTEYRDAIKIINRNFLDYDMQHGIENLQNLKWLNDIRFIRIPGIFVSGEKDMYLKQLYEKTLSLICAFARKGNCIIFELSSLNGILSYAIGTTACGYDTLKNLLKGCFQLNEVKMQMAEKHEMAAVGILTGNPYNRCIQEKPVQQIETIIDGMGMQSFRIRYIATCMDDFIVNRGIDVICDESEQVFSATKETENVGLLEGKNSTTSQERMNYHAQEYLDRLQQLEKQFQSAEKSGLWEVSMQYYGDSKESCEMLGRLIYAHYVNHEEKVERFRCIPIKTAQYLDQVFELEDTYYGFEEHSLGIIDTGETHIPLFNKKYKTLLSGSELGVLGRAPIKECPGFFIRRSLDFDCACCSALPEEKEKISLGNICTGEISNPYNLYVIRPEELARHMLIVGNSGSGKTNTIKNLMNALWKNSGIATMVIESAKTEYWEYYSQCEEMRLYTLGDERNSGIPFRMNPFERIGEVALQTHIESLLANFTAAFVLPPPMPYVLETAVYEVYEDLGWDVTKDENRKGLQLYPTLSDLYEKIDEVTERLQYHSEVDSNVKAALKARINSLRTAGKGKMLDTQESIPMEKLLEVPVVLELDSIGDDEIKGFVNGLFLVRLYEYQKSHQEDRKVLQHCMVIEEAHCLLGKVQKVAEGDNSKAKSIDYFCKMLSEIRAYGEGIIIAEQIPSKLADDVIKNTNIKIIHRTLAKDDRELIGNAMNMTEEQIGALCTLKRGFAAIYSEDDNHPKLVQVKKATQGDRALTREMVIRNIKEKCD